MYDYEKEQEALEVTKDYVEFKTDYHYKALINDKGTYREAVQEIPWFRDGMYADKLFNNMDDPEEFTCIAKEYFSEYCTDQARVFAERDSDGKSIKEMKQEMSGYIDPKADARATWISAMGAISLQRVEV